jgi:DNA-binding HxlR family transcriptional regulator
MSQAFAAPVSQDVAHSFRAPSAEPTPETLARLLGQPIRLGILRALSAQETLSFSDLKRMLRITDGNLSMHARKLEDAGVVSCTKAFRGRFPRTEYGLTADGRQLLGAFLASRLPQN